MNQTFTIYSDLLELSEEALIVRDMEDHVEFWSPGAERLYGWKSHEVIGHNLQDFLDEHLLYDNCEDPSIKNGEWAGELRHRTRDGNIVFVRSRMKLLHDDGGSPTSVLIANTDITHQKSIESALLRMQRMETVNHLVSLIAHNLNNDLALLSLHLLEQKKGVEDEHFFGALRQSSECTGMMARLLSLARGSDSERAAIPAARMIGEVVDILRLAFPKCIEIKKTVPENIWHATGNPTHLYQAVMNLCMNARDAMPSGGVLSIDVENVAEAEKRIVIKVSDTGGGIPPDIKDKLFKPFFTTKARDRASGLGLFTTASVVRDHGGSIEVFSSFGQGTQFRIYLPSAESAIEDSDYRVPYVKSA